MWQGRTVLDILEMLSYGVGSNIAVSKNVKNRMQSDKNEEA